MASARYETVADGGLRLILSGRLDVQTTGGLWREVFRRLETASPKELQVDAAGIEYLDGAGVALLQGLRQCQQRAGAAIRVEGLKPHLARLCELFSPGEPAPVSPRGPRLNALVEGAGKAAANFGLALVQTVSLVGELSVKLLTVVVRPASLRWRDTLLVAEKAGANAVGIACLLGFLIGLILAFQSAIAMKRFGAEVFVSDLVVISLLRELGPLITGFVLASRTGSAFAAEIGTMKVNEEIDALTTMGIDKTQFLVVPRVVAAVAVTPLLTLFNLLAGLAGCGLVMVSLGFPVVTYLHQIQQAAGLKDFLGGLAKTFVFGMLVAAIGCQKGLQTGAGASAVGDSATRAVVSGITAIVIADGVFAVFYYLLGI